MPTMSDPVPSSRILIVEDDAIIRMVAADILATEGYDVEEAEDAAAALRVLEARSDVRLLFTDINMPGDMDGLDLARAVHERWPDIVLVLTSGRAVLLSSEIPDDGRFVPKPYTAARLVSQVQAAIASHPLC